MASGSDRHGVADGDPALSQLRDRRVEVGDAQCEMLTDAVRNGSGNEMQLLVAGIEPRAVETKVRAVIASRESEHVGIKGGGGGHIVDVDRHVVHTHRFHQRADYVQSIATFLEGRTNTTAASLVSPIGGVVSHVRAYDSVEGDGGHLVYAAFAGRGRHPEHAPQLVGVGVGADDDAASDDALRRALGLYAAAAWDARSMRWASADELGDEALPVEELPRLASLETRDRVRWVEGFALDDGRPIWVPAILAHLALPVAVEAEAFWTPSTAGLAVADDLGAAVLTGLLDLVARDAFALASTRDAPLPRLTPPGDERAVFDATTDLGIPTALAQGAVSYEFGMGAAATAVGARRTAVDDLVRRRARRARDAYPAEPPPDPAFDPGGTDAAVDEADVNDNTAVDLSKPAIVARLRRVGLAGYAVDLTTDELASVGLSAVRVVVPGLSPIPPSPGWSDHARLARVAG